MSALDPSLAELWACVRERALAKDANDVIAQMRQVQGSEWSDAVSYEVLLSPTEQATQLRENVLPRLLYFLDCRGAKPPACPGVFISLFAGEELLFLTAADFVRVLSTPDAKKAPNLLGLTPSVKTLR